MAIFVQGAQVLARSVQGKKAALIFMTKLLINYDVEVLKYVNLLLYRLIISVKAFSINYFKQAVKYCVLFQLKKKENIYFFLYAKL